MRTTKRFTPALLSAWRDKGRGTGILSSFQPWHQVTRGDPASHGRSGLPYWRRTGRQHHLLSINEAIGFLFCTQLADAIDLREQFPLSLRSSQHELASYSAAFLTQEGLGTLELAEKLSIRHPFVECAGEREPWVFTTDLLVTLRQGNQEPTLLAISVKLDQDVTSKRTLQLLRIERAYWVHRGVPWLLLSPSLYQREVALCMRRAVPWALSTDEVSDEITSECGQFAPHLVGSSFSTAIARIAFKFQVDQQTAQLIFWQSTWCGKVRLDMARGWRPSIPLRLVSERQFKQFNPIAERRSLCLPA